MMRSIAEFESILADIDDAKDCSKIETFTQEESNLLENHYRKLNNEEPKYNVKNAAIDKFLSDFRFLRQDHNLNENEVNSIVEEIFREFYKENQDA